MLYESGKGIGRLLSAVEHKFDLLTNFAVKPEIFVRDLLGQQHKLKNNAGYPSIRVSYHANEMNKLWGEGFKELLSRCMKLKDYGFNVSTKDTETDIGIYVVDTVENTLTSEMHELYKDKIKVYTKQFLGEPGELHETADYLYPFSTDLVSRGYNTISCECHTNEILIDPLGFVWRCHSYLYEAWSENRVQKFFDIIKHNKFDCSSLITLNNGPSGHILDENLNIEYTTAYKPCNKYGSCIGCDTKFKKDRFQKSEHAAVNIRNIRLQQELIPKIKNLERSKKYLSET
jgi:hypothetical protein